MPYAHVIPRPKNTGDNRAFARALLVLTVLLGTVSCGESEQMDLTLRADAVEPPQPIDVTFTLDGDEESRTAVQPGERIQLGLVPVGTLVQFEVTNARGAGHIRAHILTDNCFRASGSCSEPGCVARAEYTVLKEGCFNP
jgi:hypothetical protein